MRGHNISGIIPFFSFRRYLCLSWLGVDIIALHISAVLFDIGYAADVLKSESPRRFLVMEYSFFLSKTL